MDLFLPLSCQIENPLTSRLIYITDSVENRNYHLIIRSIFLFQQSLWSEMLEELRFAIRCHGSTKRPALKRKCSKCVNNPSSEPCVVDSPNGIIQLRDVKKSPIPSTAPSPYRDQYREHGNHRDQGRFRYSEPQADPYHVEYRDTPT